jgi:hypothetical protein
MNPRTPSAAWPTTAAMRADGSGGEGSRSYVWGWGGGVGVGVTGLLATHIALEYNMGQVYKLISSNMYSLN